MNRLSKYFFTFIGGGFLILTIHIIANVIKNPGIAAIVSLLPISLFCCYIMESKEILNAYMKSLIYVFSISLLLIVIGYFLSRYTNLDQKRLISGLIVTWFILKLLTYGLVTHSFSNFRRGKSVNNVNVINNSRNSLNNNFY